MRGLVIGSSAGSSASGGTAAYLTGSSPPKFPHLSSVSNILRQFSKIFKNYVQTNQDCHLFLL